MATENYADEYLERRWRTREENEGEIEQEQVKWSRSSAFGSIG